MDWAWHLLGVVGCLVSCEWLFGDYEADIKMFGLLAFFNSLYVAITGG